MVIMVFLVIKHKHQVKKHFKGIFFPIMLLFSAFYIIKVILTYSNYSNSLSLNWYEYIFYFLSYSIFPFFTFACINFEKHKKVISDAIILSGFILGALSLYLYKDILTMGIGRISMVRYDFPDKETLSPLALSYSGVLTIVLCVNKLIYEKIKIFKLKIYLYVNIMLSFIMFFLGSSRGSLVVLLLSILFLVRYATLRNKSRLLLLYAVAIPLIIYGVSITGSAIFTRTENSIQTGDASGRQPLWAAAYQEFKNNPIIGGRIEVSGIYPHNIFLEVLMATGIVGFLLFAIVLFNSVRRGLIIIKSNKNYVIPLLVLINGLTQYSFSGSIYDSIFLFIPMGMIYSSSSS